MAAGAPGIYQGVLLDDARLARPDLLRRVDGASGLGNWTYVPGDIKSALTPRTDAVLQVGFAALLLEKEVGAHVARGFVVLGDGTWEDIDLDSVRCSIEEAVDRAAAIQDGRESTRPFYSSTCPRCAWRGACLSEMREGRDASFVDGMTRTLHRVLARHGVRTLDDLASVDVEALRRAGAPADGLDRLRRQAQALLTGAPVGRRRVELPEAKQREHFLHLEIDPIASGAPFLLAWTGNAPGADATEPARLAVATPRPSAPSLFRSCSPMWRRTPGPIRSMCGVLRRFAPSTRWPRRWEQLRRESAISKAGSSTWPRRCGAPRPCRFGDTDLPRLRHSREEHRGPAPTSPTMRCSSTSRACRPAMIRRLVASGSSALARTRSRRSTRFAGGCDERRLSGSLGAARAIAAS
jgi:hypothetical protein